MNSEKTKLFRETPCRNLSNAGMEKKVISLKATVFFARYVAFEKECHSIVKDHKTKS